MRGRRGRGRRPRARCAWPAWLLLVQALLFCGASPAPASDILAVLSAPIPSYVDLLRDLRTHLARLPGPGPKAVEPDLVREVILSEGDSDDLHRAVQGRRPDLILAVGRSALAATSAIPDVPVLYVLAPAAEPLVRGRANVTGVGLEVPPAVTLAALRDVLPGVRRLGLVYDPARTEALVTEAQKAAEGAGIALTAVRVKGPRGVAAALDELAGRVDALWLLPDLTVATAEGVESFLLFSQRHRVPVLAFSPYYVERGATLAVSADPGAVAEQAAHMARRLLAGATPAHVPVEPPAQVAITMNRAVAAKVGATPDPASGRTIEWVE